MTVEEPQHPADEPGAFVCWYRGVQYPVGTQLCMPTGPNVSFWFVCSEIALGWLNSGTPCNPGSAEPSTPTPADHPHLPAIKEVHAAIKDEYSTGGGIDPTRPRADLRHLP